MRGVNYMCKNIKFKRILLLSSVLIVLGSFAACSNQKDETVKNETSEIAMSEETELTTAENNTEVIAAERNVDFYKQRLDEFNRKYGTKYILPVSDKEAMEWITSLSPEAFDDFLMARYDGSAYNIEEPRVRNNDISLGGIYVEIENTDLPESD